MRVLTQTLPDWADVWRSDPGLDSIAILAVAFLPQLVTGKSVLGIG